MSEWKEYKIGDICRIKHGFAFKGIHFVDEPQKYVCVTPGNFALKGGFKNDKPKYYNGPIPEDYVLYKDDLVVTMTDLSKNSDTLGYSALIPEDNNYVFLHNQRIGLTEGISQEIDKHFLYWVMRTYDYQRYIVGHCSGSTVKHTSPSGIGSYIFRCPDINTQREISSILCSLDDKIAVNKKICENLEAQAQALFKHWFVDFAPFKDGKFVESELGLIPEGWRVGTLGDICSYSTRRISFDDLSPQTYYSTENMLPNKMGAVEASSLPNVGTTTGCEPFDVLVSNIRPYFKKILRVDSICGCSSDVMCFHPTGSKYRAYLYRILYDDSFFSFIMAGSKGTKMPRGDKQQIMKYPIVLPHESVLDHFSNCVEAMFSMTSSLKQESLRLSTLRDTLLPKLMSGQIKVDDLK